jgi:hypothetical protein
MQTLNDLDDLDDPDKILEGAAQVVESKDERIDALSAVVSAAGVDPDDVEPGELTDVTDELEAMASRADALADLADFHEVELTAEEGVQKLVDQHTADLRAEIAQKEATLPSHATGGDDGPTVEERAEELAGKSPQKLQAMDGQRASQILESEAARQEYGKAFASGDGMDGDGSSGSAGGEEANELAVSAMTAAERIDFRQSDKDAAEFMAERYGEDPADYVDQDNPVGSFLTATAQGADE